MAEQTKTTTPTATPEDIQKNKGIAAVTYVLFFLPYLAAKDSKYAMFHANQSLVLLILAVAGNFILGIIPIIGWVILPFFGIGVFVLWVIGVVNALNGKMQPLPLIGTINILPQE